MKNAAYGPFVHAIARLKAKKIAPQSVPVAHRFASANRLTISRLLNCNVFPGLAVRSELATRLNHASKQIFSGIFNLNNRLFPRQFSLSLWLDIFLPTLGFFTIFKHLPDLRVTFSGRVGWAMPPTLFSTLFLPRQIAFFDHSPPILTSLFPPAFLLMAPAVSETDKGVFPWVLSTACN